MYLCVELYLGFDSNFFRVVESLSAPLKRKNFILSIGDL